MEQPEAHNNELINIENEEDQLNGTATSREVEIKSKIHFIKAALQNLKSNFPQFKSVRKSFHITFDRQIWQNKDLIEGTPGSKSVKRCQTNNFQLSVVICLAQS